MPYNKTKPIRVEEFEPIKQWWNNREESDVAWKVGIDEVKKRGYNLDIKNPNTKVEDDLNPTEVLESYRAKKDETAKVLEQIKGVLTDALNKHKEQ